MIDVVKMAKEQLVIELHDIARNLTEMGSDNISNQLRVVADNLSDEIKTGSLPH